MLAKTGVLLVGAYAMMFSIMTGTTFAQETKTAQQAKKADEKMFQPLVQVMNIRGICEVHNPDVGQYKPAMRNKAYPMGSTFRTGIDGRCALVFSMKDTLRMSPNSEVVVEADKANSDVRIVKLIRGQIRTNIRDNPREGAFNVFTEDTFCKSLSGRGTYTMTRTPTLTILKVSTVTGSAVVEGPHYTVPALRAANAIEIQTSPNRALSRIADISGDYNIVLPNGSDKPVTYTMSPKDIVKIWRETAKIGGRMIVSVLVLKPNGAGWFRSA